MLRLRGLRSLGSKASSPAVESSSIVMNIYPLVMPEVLISTLSPDTTLYLGDVYTFLAEVTYGGTAPNYQWYINSAAVAGATNSSFTTHIYGNNDSVYCKVSGNSPCDTGTNAGVSNMIIIYGANALSTSSLTASANSLTLFPNPNTGSFILSGTLSTVTNKEVTLEVTDMLGRKIYTGTATPDNGTIRTEIKLDNDISAGTYLLRVNTETGTETFHFVVSK